MRHGMANGFSLPSNGEQEWYINSNYASTSSITPWTDSSGVMTIAAAPASAAVSSLIAVTSTRPVRSAAHQSFSQTYGFFEMRAQLPAGQGLWPAFWLLPEEMVRSRPRSMRWRCSGTTPAPITRASIPAPGRATRSMWAKPTPSAIPRPGYHTYGVDWEQDFITYYFDGQEVYQGRDAGGHERADVHDRQSAGRRSLAGQCRCDRRPSRRT